MKIFVVDFETTSSNPETARPWEFSGTVVDENYTPLTTCGFRMWSDDYEDIDPGAMRACRVDTPRLTGLPSFRECMEKHVGPLLTKTPVDYWMAYNAAFDSEILTRELTRTSYLPSWRPEPNQWICALQDVKFPQHFNCRKLSHLALDHGIDVQTSKLHGASGDVQLLIQLLKTGGYKFQDILAYKDEPWVYLEAQLPKPWGQNADVAKVLQAQAKAQGFSWERAYRTSAPVFSKRWVKRVKQSDLIAELEYPRKFSVRIIEHDSKA